MPLMILVMTFGLSSLWDRFSKFKLLLVALLLIIFVNWKPWQFVTQRFEVEELKQSLDFLCDANYDNLYVDKFAAPTFHFYLDHSNDYKNCGKEKWSFIKEENQEVKWIKGNDSSVLGFVYGAMTSKQLDRKKQQLSHYGTIENEKSWTGASLIFIKKTKD